MHVCGCVCACGCVLMRSCLDAFMTLPLKWHPASIFSNQGVNNSFTVACHIMAFNYPACSLQAVHLLHIQLTQILKYSQYLSTSSSVFVGLCVLSNKGIPQFKWCSPFQKGVYVWDENPVKPEKNSFKGL